MTGDGVNDAAAIRLAERGGRGSGRRRFAGRARFRGHRVDRRGSEASGRRVGRGPRDVGRVRDAVAILVGGNVGEVRSPSSAPRSAAARRWVPVSCCWSTCSPTCFPRSRSRWPPRGRRRRDGSRRFACRRPARRSSRWPRCSCPARTTGSPRPSGSGAGPARRRRPVPLGPGRRPIHRVPRPREHDGLAALIGTQLAQTACPARRSPLVLVTAAGSFAGSSAVVQTPGGQPVLRLLPAGTRWPGRPSSAGRWRGAAGAAAVPRWVRGRSAEPAVAEEADRPATTGGRRRRHRSRAPRRRGETGRLNDLAPAPSPGATRDVRARGHAGADEEQPVRGRRPAPLGPHPASRLSSEASPRPVPASASGSAPSSRAAAPGDVRARHRRAGELLVPSTT